MVAIASETSMDGGGVDVLLWDNLIPTHTPEIFDDSSDDNDDDTPRPGHQGDSATA